MKKNIYTFIFILNCLNFSTNFAQEESYEAISLTADDYAELASLNQQFIQAVKANDFAATQQLISQGADINHQDELGNTASHYAFSEDADFFSTYQKIRGALFIAQAKFDIPNLENKTANDFIGEIKFPVINMSPHEIADFFVDMSMRNKALLAQHKIEAEATRNPEFRNFIINREFTHAQFYELIKALDENNITEYIQRHSNQS